MTARARHLHGAECMNYAQGDLGEPRFVVGKQARNAVHLLEHVTPGAVEALVYKKTGGGEEAVDVLDIGIQGAVIRHALGPSLGVGSMPATVPPLPRGPAESLRVSASSKARKESSRRQI